MQDYEEIRKRYIAGESQRHIAKTMGISRNTVKKYCEGNAVPWERKTPERESTVLTDETVQFIKDCLQEDDIEHLKKQKHTARKIYDRLVDETGFKGGESTIRAKVHELKEAIPKAFIPLQFDAGDAMQVDWAGGTLPITDPVTGEVTDAYLFVAVLPCSCYVYAELCDNMKTENWLLAHVHAYEYFDGVPRLLIPDNLKTGVIRNTRYETQINRSYMELADHYGTAVVPTRVEHPKDKGHAEGTVSYATTWILAALRSSTFFSLSDARKAVAEKLEELNGAPFKKREGNRRQAYLREEKEFMQPLPVNPYEPSVWSEQTILYDYTVTDGINKYSVPFDLIGESVNVRIARDTVEVFYHGNRVAVHVRTHDRKRDPIMNKAHMPEHHRKYLEYTPDDFRSWASGVGPNTLKVVRSFLESGSAPEQGFKPCTSLRKLSERYSPEKLEAACRQILTFSGDPTIRGINILLKNPVNSPGTSKKDRTVRRSRGITRGAEQFREGGDLK